jgi:hypothetical protein
LHSAGRLRNLGATSGRGGHASGAMSRWPSMDVWVPDRTEEYLTAVGWLRVSLDCWQMRLLGPSPPRGARQTAKSFRRRRLSRQSARSRGGSARADRRDRGAVRCALPRAAGRTSRARNRRLSRGSRAPGGLAAGHHERGNHPSHRRTEGLPRAGGVRWTDNADPVQPAALLSPLVRIQPGGAHETAPLGPADRVNVPSGCAVASRDRQGGQAAAVSGLTQAMSAR